MPTRPPPQTGLPLAVALPYRPGAGAEEDADDDVVGDGQQPPLDQDQAAGEVLGVLDVEVRGVGGVLGQAERGVAVGGQGAVGVVGDPPGPAQDADVEVEDGPGVAAGHQDRHEGHDAEHREGDPQEGQDDVVRDRQQPLDQPEPARGRGRLGVGPHVHRVVEGRGACGRVRCCHGGGPSLEAPASEGRARRPGAGRAVGPCGTASWASSAASGRVGGQCRVDAWSGTSFCRKRSVRM